jgi:hypothetical protein
MDNPSPELYAGVVTQASSTTTSALPPADNVEIAPALSVTERINGGTQSGSSVSSSHTSLKQNELTNACPLSNFPQILFLRLHLLLPPLHHPPQQPRLVSTPSSMPASRFKSSSPARTRSRSFKGTKKSRHRRRMEEQTSATRVVKAVEGLGRRRVVEKRQKEGKN